MLAEKRINLKKRFEEKLTKLLSADEILYNEPMKNHTTFRVGGEVEYFLMPSSVEKIQAVINLLRECAIPFLTVGNGSNLLVGDGGLEGAVLHLGKKFSEIHVNGTHISAQAGTLLSAIANRAVKESLTGLEFAAGIPGSLGGAITMNAGAYGGEMKQVTESVCVLTEDGQVRTIPKEEMEFAYRHSIVTDRKLLVLSAAFSLEKGDANAISETMQELSRRRREKQPLEYGSAGSTFKRPEGYFAGKLIMDAGLAGYQVGGARVSEKHCGFVINAGDATAQDVAAVMEHVKKVVMDKFSVVLEPEIKLAGRF